MISSLLSICSRYPLLVPGLLFATLILTCNPSYAEDATARDFLAGLRKRGWHDVALEYLESASEDPLAGSDFLQQVDYERAVTLATMAQSSLRDSQRTNLYDKSISLFRKYARENKSTRAYFDSMSRVAKMLGEQARGKASAAKLLPTGSGGRRDSLYAQARLKFDASDEVLTKLLKECRGKLSSLPKGALSHQDPAINELRQKIVTTEAEARFLAANLRFEKADTYESTSTEFRAGMEAAAESFSALHKDYEEKLVGFFGRLFEGRSRQSLKQWSKALKCYDDLVGQPISNPEFRRLVARAYRHRAECLSATGKLEEAIEECSDWLQQSQASEKREPEWLAVSFRLAEALRQLAAKSTGSDSRRLENEARELLREVAQNVGEFQAAAKASLASSEPTLPTTPTEVETFQQAFAAGKQALDRMKSSQLASQLAARNNPAAQPNLQAQADAHRTAAKQLFQIALQLADTDSSNEDLLSAQFYLCFFYWEEKQVCEAAVLGNYIARQFPDSSYAVSAAKVALVARDQLYRDEIAAGRDASYESQQLSDLAEYMARRWAGSSEAAAATSLLIQIALKENRVDDAEAMLERLPPDGRASGQFSLGSSLWTRYLRESRGQAGQLADSTKRLKARAFALLAAGYRGLPEGQTPTGQEANGILYYLQALLADGKFSQASQVLNHPTAGPLVLADKPGADRLFQQEAYKAALRTYVSVKPPRRKQALEVMDKLEASVGGQEKQVQLTRVYLSLGKQLQRQITELTQQGKQGQARQVAKAFEDLLQRITSRSDTKDWSVRAWIAQTNLQLGEGLSSKDAAGYLEQAQEMFEAMLQDARSDPSYAPSPDAVLAVRKQLGDCLRAQGRFDKALQQYQDILKQKPNTLDLQRSVALMLQQWGKQDRAPERIDSAIRGALPQANNRNLIWGWLRMESIISRQMQRVTENTSLAAKYHNFVFEARYNIAKSRLLAAQVTSGATKAKNLERANKYLESMRRLYPEMGGASWQTAFQELQKEIDAEG